MISGCAYIKISYEEQEGRIFCYCRKHRIREQYEQEAQVKDLSSCASETDRGNREERAKRER